MAAHSTGGCELTHHGLEISWCALCQLRTVVLREGRCLSEDALEWERAVLWPLLLTASVSASLRFGGGMPLGLHSLIQLLHPQEMGKRRLRERWGS